MHRRRILSLHLMVYDDEGNSYGNDEYNDMLRTTILDTSFVIDAEEVRYALDENHSRNHESSVPHNFDYGVACRLIYKDDTLTGYYSKADDMKLLNRILHPIVCQVLNPRKRVDMLEQLKNISFGWLGLLRIIHRTLEK